MTNSRLTASFRSAFDPAVRDRGSNLHRQAGAVEIFHLTDNQLFARLPGGERYVAVIADIDEDEEEIGIGCSCAVFREGELCHHVWAALLAAEEAGGLGSFSSERTEPIVLTPEEFDEVETEINRAMFARNLARRADGDRPPDIIEQVRRSLADEAAAVIASADRTSAARSRGKRKQDSKQKAEWEESLDLLERNLSHDSRERNGRAKEREISYIIDGSPAGTDRRRSHYGMATDLDELVIATGFRERKKNGEMGALRFTPIDPGRHRAFVDPLDRTIIAFLDAAGLPVRTPAGRNNGFLVQAGLLSHLFDLIAPTGRLLAHGVRFDEQRPIDWSPQKRWHPEIRVDRPGRTQTVRLSLAFGDGTRSLELKQVKYLATGFLLADDRIVPVGDPEEGLRLDRLVDFFLARESVELPAKEVGGMLEKIAGFRSLPPLRIDEKIDVERVTGSPVPTIHFRSESGETMRGSAAFLYDGRTVPAGRVGSSIWSAEEKRMIVRDLEAESGFLTMLEEQGFRRQTSFYRNDEESIWTIATKRFVRGVSGLIENGWEVEAEGRSYRSGTSVEIEVTSGVDWFDLEGAASFDGAAAPFPELLRAIRDGERFLLLDDGTYGLIPEEWVRRYGGFAGNIDRKKGGVRFRSNQMVLLDILLAELPDVKFDRQYRQRREQLQSFNGVGAADPPKSFVGELRPYQKMALGWFSFLRDFGFGGCLADDMGLGKTVQVLALLEERRSSRRRGKKPSLAVVPKSLIFNWMREAESFAPKLKILDYTGTARRDEAENLTDYHVILTTYGTLRRDVADLKEIGFDYVILDESQAIKNPRSATAKSVRLLQADHRLAMSGTPIENRLDELWSLFEFLNPGMLGSSSAFRRLTAGAAVEDDGGEQKEKESGEQGDGSQASATTNEAIGQAVRPFILRRTKQQVAPELPERVEQTLYCELDGDRRREYDELRDYIRAGVMGEVEEQGVAKSSFRILEGLLRLRQAASHPGLLDPKKKKLGSAKFDLLLPKLAELEAEGEKVLIFSQFTSLLDLLKVELKRQKMRFEYLDGQTRDRQARVDSFQNSPDIPLFLISLKAGGVGLNLTAASWVFLLDPWWNPAVEAQAIDRTHRIGQTSTVFANRLIVRDTIEEKVLALQQQKKELADSILTGKNSMIGSLTKEELERLLS